MKLVALPPLALITYLFAVSSGATLRSMPNFDYGGKTHEEFIREAVERSSPGNARILAELFGGLELGLELGSGSQAVISVGGAATRCQHQSPCFDSRCNLCYDPLLRIHGKCGGASYFTCLGTLPRACMPYTCTAMGGHSEDTEETVMVKKFPRFEDPFCLGLEEKARSLDSGLARGGNETGGASSTRGISMDPEVPEWALSVPDSVTPCQGYDLCLDLRCGNCYDPYLGAHTTCGKLTYYDCSSQLPQHCKPIRCTMTDINKLFPSGGETARQPRARREAEELREVSPLMVRNFPPLSEDRQNCL